MTWAMRNLRATWLSLALAALAAGLLTAAACGDDDDAPAEPTPAASLGDLRIFDPWVRTTSNDVSAGYFRVENVGEADRLVSATADVTSMVQLHEVVTEGSSSKMQPKEGGFPVPANDALELKPGGFHLMLMNLASPLEADSTVELELTFEKAGKVTLSVPVRAAATIGDAAEGH